ncbi:MAG: chorismate synthase, partial [Planctomycetota bacterium]
MSGLRWNTAGESHGKALVGVLEGLPSGLALDVAAIDAQLARRQRGHGRSARQQLESDRIEVLGGLRHGRTLGAPLALALANKDASIEALPVPGDPRPGHADLAGCQKHGVRDPRLVLERASARETAMRTALGAAAAQLLA